MDEDGRCYTWGGQPRPYYYRRCIARGVGVGGGRDVPVDEEGGEDDTHASHGISNDVQHHAVKHEASVLALDLSLSLHHQRTGHYVRSPQPQLRQTVRVRVAVRVALDLSLSLDKG